MWRSRSQALAGAASGDEIVWMRGFPVPARLRAQAGQEAVMIREMPWAVEGSAI
jgi:hypothetical protein